MKHLVRLGLFMYLLVIITPFLGQLRVSQAQEVVKIGYNNWESAQRGDLVITPQGRVEVIYQVVPGIGFLSTDFDTEEDQIVYKPDDLERQPLSGSQASVEGYILIQRGSGDVPNQDWLDTMETAKSIR